jgi:hypothetical protein
MSAHCPVCPKAAWLAIYEYLPPRSATARFVLCPLFVVCWLMDREKLKRQLEEAEENVAHGVRLVVEQWNLIARLEQKSRDTADARRVLKLLEENRDLHIAERDRLLRFTRDYFPEVQRVEGPPAALEDGTPA